MELPFAVDATASSDNDASSLVTASSQGSLVPADDFHLSSHSSNHQQQLGRGDDSAPQMDDDHAIVSSFAMLPTTSTTDRPHTAPPIQGDVKQQQQQQQHQYHHTPRIQQQPSFQATIAALPPNPSHVKPQPVQSGSQMPSTFAADAVVHATSSSVSSSSTSSFGVDALKSASSRVSSVLSHFGYSRGVVAASHVSTSAVPDATTATAVAGRQPASQSLSQQQQQQHRHMSSINNETRTRPASLNSTLPLQPYHEDPPDTEAIDFAYINVTDEDEVDIWLDESHPFGAGALQSTSSPNDIASDGVEGGRGGGGPRRGDILAILLQGARDSANEETHKETSSSLPQQPPARLVALTEKAHMASELAATAKQNGQLQEALDRHAEAAKLFHEAASVVQEYDASMASALLLLSQSQAKSAHALKRVIKMKPNALSSTFPSSSNTGSTSSSRLRATVRGALSSNREADISDSTFLGKATKPPVGRVTPSSSEAALPVGDSSPIVDEVVPDENPVDEMMELERELREMDMTLALGNSIASLDARTQNRMKSSVTDSFMVVPGSGSYMSSSSSIILGPATSTSATSGSAAGAAVTASRPNSGVVVGAGGTAGVRARANRVQSLSRPMGGHPSVPPNIAPSALPLQQPQVGAPKQPPHQPQSLESSWWGNASTASQILSASVVSLSSVGGLDQQQRQQQQSQPANTTQLMRLMDSLRTLGDENAALLKEVEGAEAARIEAKTAREQMKRFKEEYGKRFTALKEALERFRKGYPGDNASNGEQNPVTSSAFSRSASASDQLQRQEQIIRKLTVDLNKAKEESKKKDTALRKYESFYREVKARSAQKAAQRQLHPQPPQSSLRK